MNTRYLSNLVLAIIAGFLVVATQAFALPAVTALVFAIAIAITVLSLGTLALRPTLAQRGISGVATVIGIWTIVASLVFAPSTVLWLGFASAVAVVGLAIGGLTAHELTTERVVHSLDIDHERSMDREPIAA